MCVSRHFYRAGDVLCVQINEDGRDQRRHPHKCWVQTRLQAVTVCVWHYSIIQDPKWTLVISSGYNHFFANDLLKTAQTFMIITADTLYEPYLCLFLLFPIKFMTVLFLSSFGISGACVVCVFVHYNVENKETF